MDPRDNGTKNVRSKTRTDLNPSSHSTIKRRPHKVYHFDIVHFAVEDCIFKIPKRNLQFSSFFKDIFGPPKNEAFGVAVSGSIASESGGPTDEPSALGLVGEGDSDDNPIVLEGISKDDFVSFLKVLYPKNVDEKFDLSLSQLTAVLDLAHMWGFNDVRNFAIKSMAKLYIEPVEKARLANKYEVNEWYEDAYFNIAKRPEPLSLGEAQRLGLEFVTKLARVREMRYSESSSMCDGTASHLNAARTDYVPRSIKNTVVNDYSLRVIVRREFGLYSL